MRTRITRKRAIALRQFCARVLLSCVDVHCACVCPVYLPLAPLQACCSSVSPVWPRPPPSHRCNAICTAGCGRAAQPGAAAGLRRAPYHDVPRPWQQDPQVRGRRQAVSVHGTVHAVLWRASCIHRSTGATVRTRAQQCAGLSTWQVTVAIRYAQYGTVRSSASTVLHGTTGTIPDALPCLLLPPACRESLRQGYTADDLTEDFSILDGEDVGYSWIDRSCVGVCGTYVLQTATAHC